MHHEREMLAAGFRCDARISLVVEPFVAHRNVFPPYAAARGWHRRTQVFNFGAALQSDKGAKLQLIDGTFGWNFGEMRRTKDLAGADAAGVGDRMSSEIAKILRCETAK